MVLEFWWGDAYFGVAQAHCGCADPAERAPALLAGLLADDGGLDGPRTLARLDACIERLGHVRSGRIAHCEWQRETLGAHIVRDGVRIGWLRRVEATETVALDDFERALLAWRAFLAAGQHGMPVRVVLGDAAIR